MSLHGTLETFALPDVMALLAATKKTGELRVVGGKLDGRVHLDAGRVVAADVGRADSFVDAVFELLRLETGKFSFDADKTADEGADPVEVEPLLLEAQARLTEWRDIEAVVPSLDHGVVLVKDLADPHVTLAADQWRMVVAVAAARCVADVADRLGLGEYGVCKSLKHLVEAGVAEITEAVAPKPEPKVEPKPEPKVEGKAEAKVDAKADKPEAKADEPTVDEANEAESRSEPVKAEVDEAKAVIEPELRPKPEPDGIVKVKALTTTDTHSPIPPGDEPGTRNAKADTPKPAPAKPAVDPSQAKQLVSQLAAMGSEKDDKPEKGAKGDKAAASMPKAAKDAGDATPGDEAGATPSGPAAEGGDTEEPLNRGLLLKFLSSVRQ